MCKKIILLILICCMTFAGFAQKNKQKTTAKSPKNTYFQMLVNGSTTLEKFYCPNKKITFDLSILDTSIKIVEKCWYYDFKKTCNTSHFEQTFQHIDPYPIINSYTVELYIEYKKPPSETSLFDTLKSVINVDFVRVAFDTTVCQGKDIEFTTYLGETITFKNAQKDTLIQREFGSSVSGCDSVASWYIKMIPYHRDTLKYEDHGYKVCEGRSITVVTAFGSTYTYPNVNSDIITPYDTLKSETECTRLVCLLIKMDPYITEEYSISSCGSVKWGDSIVSKPNIMNGDTTFTIERKYSAMDQNISCDTIKTLKVTIIDKKKLKINFDQKEFCKNDDPKGTIDLETNFTAFHWKRPENTDTTIFRITSLEIEFAGRYEVTAYMDTSLYDTLKDLRITNCDTSAFQPVNDCDVIIPNIITPNGDNRTQNEVLGIKKLNPKRENELTIYDRWGKVVFHQKNYKCVFKNSNYENTEKAFKGLSMGGQKLPDGTYPYAFKYAQIPKPKTYKGIITIAR